MHGKKKVQRSAEEDDKRIRKVAAYQKAMKLIFAKRANGELDEELSAVISQVLTANPDISTLWNIRKEMLLKIKNENPEKFTEIVPKELDLVEACLRGNPKSYGAWYHRWWLMKETNFERVAEEIKLCSKYLHHTESDFIPDNFPYRRYLQGRWHWILENLVHVWDYRRFLVANSPDHSMQQELDYTTEKIQTNFSNYSSWHLRSKLLPQLSQDYLTKELDLVKNAAFTDPNDQSVWFYHKRLVASHLRNVTPKLDLVLHTNDNVYFLFDSCVANPSQMNLNVKLVFKNLPETTEVDYWSSPLNSPTSKLWILKLSNTWKDLPSHFIISKSPELQVPENLPKIDEQSVILDWNGCARRLRFEEDAAESTSFLNGELEWVQELNELEPDNKWSILNRIHLLRLIDFESNKSKIYQLLDELEKLDQKRINFYRHLRAKYDAELSVIKELNSGLNPPISTYILPAF